MLTSLLYAKAHMCNFDATIVTLNCNFFLRKATASNHMKNCCKFQRDIGIYVFRIYAYLRYVSNSPRAINCTEIGQL